MKRGRLHRSPDSMQHRTLAIAFVTACLAVTSLVTPAAAQLCGPADNPCLVTSMNVPSGSVFDLGNRDLIIVANQTLTVQGAGVLTILARNITLDDGARIVAFGSAGVGGDVTLSASGPLVMDPDSRIDVTAGIPGSITLMAASVQMNGSLRAFAGTRDGDGGIVSITTSGNVTIGGAGIIANSGNRFGCGGFGEIFSDGNVIVSSPIEYRGGDCDGGDIDIDALGDVTITSTAILTTSATNDFGSGGAVTLTAVGDVVVDGQVLELGAGSLLEGGGDGGDFDVIGNNVELNGPITLTGAARDGGGGFADVTALGLLEVNGPMTLSGPLEGVGGDVLLSSDGDTHMTGSIMADAGFAGGSFDVISGGAFTVSSAVTINVSATGSAFGQFGGTVDVRACDILLPLGSDVLATGTGPVPRATVRLFASGLMTIGGNINAGAAVLLYYRTFPPAFLPGFTISPAPAVTPDSTLPCCIACGGTSTTSTSTTSSTSSSIGGGSTTVTSTSTSSSTSTIPVPCGVPLTGCRTPSQLFKAKLVVKDNPNDATDKIVWKWVRGQATAAADFGNPVTTDDYVLCLWSVAGGTPTLLTRVDAPAGGLCDGKACWRSTGRAVVNGYKYADAELTPNGAKKIGLKSGVEGKAKVVVKAKGLPLSLPSLPLTLPVRVQLQGAGRCWEAYFQADGLARNTIEEFEGRASAPSTTTTTSTSITTTTSPVPVCGNGAWEGTEMCDDGNVVAGDCCSPTCTAEPLGQACAEDGNVCSLDVCSGLGLCVHVSGHAGLTCRPAADQCDAGEQCSGVSVDCPPDVPMPDGTACDAGACFTDEACTAGVCGDGTPVACDACDACDTALGCVPTPATVCRLTVLPEKSILLLRDRTPDDSDKFVWKWVRGALTTTDDFGTPNLDDGYTACLYDESGFTPTLLTELSAPAAGLCGSAGCWRTTSAGWKYVDDALTPDGVKKLLLKAGVDGSAQITLKGKGPLLPLPTMPLAPMLRLQLRGNDECWQATFSPSGISQNDASLFKARSD